MKRIMKNAILTMVFLTLSISAALFIYLHFFAPGNEDLTGEWTANLDMTEHAAVTAYIWLQDIEAVSISLEDMYACMQELTVQVNLTFEQTGHAEGTFRCNIQPESYDACRQAAYEAFAAAFRELLSDRLRLAGYTGSTDKEAVEALITEAFGMSAVSYLMSYGPVLLPALEELQAYYDGSGTYETAEGILKRQFDVGDSVGAREERYIRKDSSLILSEENGSGSSGILSDSYPMIYTLKQNQNP